MASPLVDHERADILCMQPVRRPLDANVRGYCCDVGALLLRMFSMGVQPRISWVVCSQGWFGPPSRERAPFSDPSPTRNGVPRASSPSRTRTAASWSARQHIELLRISQRVVTPGGYDAGPVSASRQTPTGICEKSEANRHWQQKARYSRILPPPLGLAVLATKLSRYYRQRQLNGLVREK